MSDTPLDPGLRQREAYELGASVWVAASAGTGKTTVLTNRVLSLLLSGSLPSRILCLTFTKAAAAEMANRINENLSRWAIIGDDALAAEIQNLTGAVPDRDALDHARCLLATVLDAPGRMTISTIHAFCQSLLRRFPLEAGVPPHFELMDERTSGEALEAAREAVLDRARGHPGSALAAALVEVVDHIHESGFAELLGKLAVERARLADVLARGEAHFAAALRSALGVAEGETAESVLAAASAPGAGDEAGLLAAADAMAASASSRDHERGAILAAWLADPLARVQGFDDYLGIFFTQEGKRQKDIVTRKIADQRRDIALVLEIEAERLQRVRERRSAAEVCSASLAVARLAGAMLDEYERFKAARALLDYDDLVLKARDMLRQPDTAPWVLYKLDGGLDHLLIDEAQDTNPDQWEIVRLLVEEFFAGEGAREAQRTVFVVGDTKQSIFSFQRADPAKFNEMLAYFEQAVVAAEARWRLVPLEISFRSSAPVLRAVDAVFARAPASDGVAFDAVPLRHRAYRQGAAGLVELWPPVAPTEQVAEKAWSLPLTQHSASEARARLALAIAATIKRWLETHERLEARDRPIRAGDVMVLVRRRGPFVTELVRALKQRGVPVAGVDRMLLADQLAVEDLTALGRFLLLPEDDLTLAAVLKGPLFGFAEEVLFDLAWPRPGTLWAELLRRRDERPDFARAAAELSDLLARADFVPPYELFAEVLGPKLGRKAILARLGPEAGDPLDEFLAAALAYERNRGVSLQGFLHWLTAGEVEIKRDLDRGGREEVRVMTVHGAKGLEAPIVFLPDTLQAPRKTAPVLWSGEDLPLWLVTKDALPAVASAALDAACHQRDQEYRRLLYVAMTRAEDRLYICGWHMRQTPPAHNWHALATAGLKAAGATEFSFDSAMLIGGDGWSGTGLRLTSLQTVKPASDRVSQRARFGAALPPEWCWRPAPEEPTPPKPLAPSRPREEEPAARSPLGDDRGAAFLRGRLVHRLLQSLPSLPPERRASAARRFLARPVHGLDAARQEAILRETLAVLEDPKFAPLFAPGSAAEVSVVGLFGGRPLSGQIDRLVAEDDAVTIIDYKTMRPVPQNAGEVPAAYLDQLAAYRAAVSAVYPGKAVRCALLWTDGPVLMPIDESLLNRHL